MFQDYSIVDAIIFGGAFSAIMTILWVIITLIFGLPTKDPLVSFFIMAAPVVFAIAIFQLSPFLLAPTAQGDTQDQFWNLPSEGLDTKPTDKQFP